MESLATIEISAVVLALSLNLLFLWLLSNMLSLWPPLLVLWLTKQGLLGSFFTTVCCLADSLVLGYLVKQN